MFRFLLLFLPISEIFIAVHSSPIIVPNIVGGSQADLGSFPYFGE